MIEYVQTHIYTYTTTHTHTHTHTHTEENISEFRLTLSNYEPNDLDLF